MKEQRVNEVKKTKCLEVLEVLAWTSWKLEQRTQRQDADDFLQNLAIAESLIAHGAFDHEDLLRRYRDKERNKRDSGGKQFRKCLDSDDPRYKAKGGVTSGAAMKVAMPTIFFFEDREVLLENILRITEVTHNTIDAKLSALLVSLRIRQALLGEESIEALQTDLHQSIAQLGWSKKARFFLQILQQGLTLTHQEPEAQKLFDLLQSEIGIAHLAWSVPIAATLWSYRADNDFHRWLELSDPTCKSMPLQKRSKRAFWSRLLWIGHLREYHRWYGKRCRGPNFDTDYDTFLCIASSIIAARDGHQLPKEEVQQATHSFGFDLKSIASQF